MTRATFLAFFGLGAAGQQKQTGYRKPPWVRREYGVYSSINGECPVCGTQAPAFTAGPAAMCADVQVLLPNGKSSTLCDKQFWHSRREVTCARCRVKFDQDAEVER